MYFYTARFMGLGWMLSYSWGYDGWKGLFMDEKKKKTTCQIILALDLKEILIVNGLLMIDFLLIRSKGE